MKIKILKQATNKSTKSDPCPWYVEVPPEPSK
jgi:hypothetical protein